VTAGEKTFSKDWTIEERIRLVFVLTSLVRDDIFRNQYGAAGRPNIQALHEMLIAPPDELEKYRAGIDALVDEFGRDRAFGELPPWLTSRAISSPNQEALPSRTPLPHSGLCSNGIGPIEDCAFCRKLWISYIDSFSIGHGHYSLPQAQETPLTSPAGLSWASLASEAPKNPADAWLEAQPTRTRTTPETVARCAGVSWADAESALERAASAGSWSKYKVDVCTRCGTSSIAATNARCSECSGETNRSSEWQKAP
jgi:ribosomal protein L37E